MTDHCTALPSSWKLTKKINKHCLQHDIDYLAQVKAKEALFREKLEVITGKFNVFSEVRGKGLLIGAVVNEQYQGKAREFLNAGINHGLMCLIAGANVVRFAPALNISEADINEAMKRFEAAVADVVANA